MIIENSFKKEWILKIKGEKGIDQAVIEREIYALSLLEELTDLNIDFIFKGGTCLSLLLDDFPRFLVDIDILVDDKIEEKFLNEIKTLDINKSRFL